MLHYSRLLFVIVLFLGCKTAINAPVDTSLNTKPTKAYQEQIENMEQEIFYIVIIITLFQM